ncbi:hypothetical protein [Halalkalibacillus halophilus]|uniref:hypothetical protein n=1 Tax=Halalkalibacillus halophilus TaxID=392827 RepID=UPI00040F04C5|nr:hypothetical protein [Halalkalibacillus halophilus]
MYPWISPIDSKNEGNHDYLEKEVSVEKISTEDFTSSLSPTFQFLAYTSYALQSQIYLVVPTPNKKAESLVMDQLAPHFNHR